MVNHCDSFNQLIEQYVKEVDFQIRSFPRNGKVLVLAPHGGGIEPGTSELAIAIAGNELPLYLFEGIRRVKNNQLHITSHHFDEPHCLEMLSSYEKVLTIHGCKWKEPIIYVGGRDDELTEKLLFQLGNKYPFQLGSSWRYAGQQKMNICNRTKTNRGVQLEFSTGIRKELFKNYRTHKGRHDATQFFISLTEDIRDVILK